MADYRYFETDKYITRTADNATIPNEPLNTDWQTYQAWLAAGGVPDPYVPPPAPEPVLPAPEVTDLIMLDQENRIRSLEGRPPLDLDEFRKEHGL